MKQNFLSWEKIETAPETPGIYAWYYQPTLNTIDIEQLKTSIEKHKKNIEDGEKIASAIIQNFLEENIFSFFKTEDIDISITGKLVPRYSGQLAHILSISNMLVAQIYADSGILDCLQKTLKKTIPLFASPIYIGQAQLLQSRLKSHKDHIIKIANGNYDGNDQPANPESEFAHRVIKRNLIRDRLFVAFLETNAYGPMENILNRLFFPILGRN